MCTEISSQPTSRRREFHISDVTRRLECGGDRVGNVEYAYHTADGTNSEDHHLLPAQHFEVLAWWYHNLWMVGLDQAGVEPSRR
jgi:hypothetical protein